MADIQGAAATTATPVFSSGQSSSVESVDTERRTNVDSVTERAEPERSETGPGVGERVDIQA